MNQFQTYYTDLQFERAGLFEAIARKYSCRKVLYPGCSVHITPSLFFPHMVYVDQSEQAERFFAEEASLLAYVNRRKQYKRSAYIRFLRQDYSQPLPLRDGSFDLVLALFAGGIARSCWRYLRPGGLLISNNHRGDAVEAQADTRLARIATIQARGGQYRVTPGGADAVKAPGQRSEQSQLQGTGGKAQYVDRETYYVFEKQEGFSRQFDRL